MDLQKLRVWWWQRQGLDGGLADSGPADVLDQAGWARSVGGAGPYLSLFARAGSGRATVDQAVADLEIHELPAARGCTYVVPASDSALALKAGQAFAGADMKIALKLGVTEREIDRLCAAVLRALAPGPLEPDELRDAVGGSVRNLGAEGEKKGLSTTLPLALGRLQAEGEMRRIPTNGRLDQQRYRYARWHPNPLTGHRFTAEEANTELARRYFKWIGPATLAEFQWFAGLGVKAAKAAAGSLTLEAVEGERLILSEDREAFERSEASADPQYALVGSLDSIVLLRRDLKSLLDDEDFGREVFADHGSKPLGGLSDLPNHAILDRGRVVGLWEYDPVSESIAWWSFIRPDTALRQAVARTQEYVQRDLGDARSFSLDSPKSRAPRIQGLRTAAGR